MTLCGRPLLSGTGLRWSVTTGVGAGGVCGIVGMTGGAGVHSSVHAGRVRTLLPVVGATDGVVGQDGGRVGGAGGESGSSAGRSCGGCSCGGDERTRRPGIPSGPHIGDGLGEGAAVGIAARGIFGHGLGDDPADRVGH